MSVAVAIRSLPWLGIEGTRDSLPFLARARDIPASLVGTSELPCLFVITYSYNTDHPTRLPSQKQYDEIGRFEERIIDELEYNDVGVLTFNRTWNASIRYFCYVTDQQKTADFVRVRMAKDWTCELAADEDPEWSEYRRLAAGFRR